MNVTIKNEESEEESGRPYLGQRIEMRRMMIHQAQQKDYKNLSDDGDMQGELDDTTTKIPTLQTYASQEP